MNKSNLWFGLAALTSLAGAQEVVEDTWWHWGMCPHRPDPVGNFEVEKYMGYWY